MSISENEKIQIDNIRIVLQTLNNQTSPKTFHSIESIHPDLRLAFQVITENTNTYPICSSFSSPDLHNLSSTYEYANKPPIYNCSHPEIVPITPNAPKFCSFGPRQNLCVFYNPDIKIIASAVVKNWSKSFTVYLTRFRSNSGSYLYKIYDQEKNVYYDLDYQKETIDFELDKEAMEIYLQFLNSNFEFFEIQNNIPQIISVPKLSYMKSLILDQVTS